MVIVDAPAIVAPPARRRPRRTLRKFALGARGHPRLPRHVAAAAHPRPRQPARTSRPRPTTLAQLAVELRDLEFWRNVGPHDDGMGDRPAHRDRAGGRARHRHRPRAVPATRDAHDGGVPAADPVGRAHPARHPHVRVPAAGRAHHHRLRELLAGVHPGALRRRRRRRRRPRHRTQLRTVARIAHRQPRLPHRAAVPHDRPAARRDRRAHPRHHRRDVHRQPRTRTRDHVRARRRAMDRRSTPSSSSPACSGSLINLVFRAIERRVAARGTSRCGGRKSCDPLHEHRRHAAPPVARVGEVRREHRLRARAADHPPRHLGHLVDGLAAHVLPRVRPSIFEAFVDTWIGPAFCRSTCCRASAASRIGIVARDRRRRSPPARSSACVRWLRELLEPMLEFFRAVPPPVLIPIIAVLARRRPTP